MKLVVMLLLVVGSVLGQQPPPQQLCDAAVALDLQIGDALGRLLREANRPVYTLARRFEERMEFQNTTCPNMDPFAMAIMVDEVSNTRESLRAYEAAKKQFDEVFAAYNTSITEAVDVFKNGRCKGDRWCHVKEWVVILCIIGVATAIFIWIYDKLERAYPEEMKMFDQFCNVLGGLAILHTLRTRARCH